MAEEEKIDRQSCLFYESYFAIADLLASGEKSYQFMKKLFDYGTKEIEPDFSEDEVASIAWVLIKPLLDANIRNYRNGCKGGAPKGTVNNPKGVNQYSKKNKKTRAVDGDRITEDNHGKTKGKPKDNQMKTDGKPEDNHGKTGGKGNDNVNVNEKENEININIIKHNNINSKKKGVCAPPLSALGGAEGRPLVDDGYEVKPFDELEEGERWT